MRFWCVDEQRGREKLRSDRWRHQETRKHVTSRHGESWRRRRDAEPEDDLSAEANRRRRHPIKHRVVITTTEKTSQVFRQQSKVSAEASDDKLIKTSTYLSHLWYEHQHNPSLKQETVCLCVRNANYLKLPAFKTQSSVSPLQKSTGEAHQYSAADWQTALL